MNREVKQAQRWGVRSEPATHTTNVSLWSIATLIHNFSSPFLCNSLLFHHRSLSFGVLPQADLIHWRDTEPAGASKMGSFKRNSLVRLPVIRLWITGMAQGPCWTGPTKSSWSHSGLKIRWNTFGSTWQIEFYHLTVFFPGLRQDSSCFAFNFYKPSSGSPILDAYDT